MANHDRRMATGDYPRRVPRKPSRPAAPITPTGVSTPRVGSDAAGVPPGSVPRATQGASMASQHTPADDIVYDLVSIQYHALQAAQTYARYLEDAEDHE